MQANMLEIRLWSFTHAILVLLHVIRINKKNKEKDIVWEKKKYNYIYSFIFLIYIKFF